MSNLDNTVIESSSFPPPTVNDTVLVSDLSEPTSTKWGYPKFRTWQFYYEEVANTDGGAAATGAWTTRALNTTHICNTDTTFTLAGNQITCNQTGNYRIFFQQNFGTTGRTTMRVYNVTDAMAVPGSVIPVRNGGTGNMFSAGTSSCSFSTGDVIELQYYASSGGSGQGLGSYGGDITVPNVFASINFTEII